MTTLRNHLTRDPEGRNFEIVGRALEPAMFVLSLLVVPVILGPLLADLSDEATRALFWCGVAIWAAFAVEFALLWYLAPDRPQMVKTHKLDLLIVLLPFLRPLQFLRVLHVAAAATGMGRAVRALRRVCARPGFQPFFGVVGGVIVAGAAFALAFEHEQPGSSIGDFGDALWWSLVTCTTVGYGDHFPVTGGGRAIAVVLMIVGIAGLSMLTASIAALFVDQDDEPEVAQLRAQLDRIEALLSERTHP